MNDVHKFNNGICHVGDCRELCVDPVQCIVTSPAYWAKRKYGHGESIYGGDPNCEHDFTAAPPPRSRTSKDAGKNGLSAAAENFDATPSAICRRCSAWRGELGQEPNPQMFAEHLADILTALPLKDDGLIWVNIADTYIAGKGLSGGASPVKGERRHTDGETLQSAHTNTGGKDVMRPQDNMKELRGWNLKPKDLAGVPYRLAFSMQAREFYWRDTIIWHKKNAMPESVGDRLWSKHEVILMFSKSPKYYFDALGVAEKLTAQSVKRMKAGKINKIGEYWDSKGKQQYGDPKINDVRRIENVWRVPTACHKSDVGAHVAVMPYEICRRCILLATKPGDVVLDPFAGTGTVCHAAEDAGRKWVAADIDPRLPDFLRERLAGKAGVGRII